MNKTLTALLATLCLFSFGAAQAADATAPSSQPAAEATAPAKMAKPAKGKTVVKHKKAKHAMAKKAV